MIIGELFSKISQYHVQFTFDIIIFRRICYSYILFLILFRTFSHLFNSSYNIITLFKVTFAVVILFWDPKYLDPLIASKLDFNPFNNCIQTGVVPNVFKYSSSDILDIFLHCYIFFALFLLIDSNI